MAHTLGFAVRIGEVLRFEEQARYNATHCAKCKTSKTLHQNKKHPFKAIGIVNSLHRSKLAIDIILCVNGTPQWSTETYRQLGEYWCRLHKLCRWGGDFGDGGHFSVTHGGRK